MGSGEGGRCFGEARINATVSGRRGEGYGIWMGGSSGDLACFRGDWKRGGFDALEKGDGMWGLRVCGSESGIGGFIGGRF